MNATKTKSGILIILLLCLITQSVSAEISLPRLISHNMVLQRNMNFSIWGWADRGETVNVTFLGVTRTTSAADDGRWEVIFPGQPAGGPYEMTISGQNKLILGNILIGDVWVCSGQSNMHFKVKGAKNSHREISGAQFPDIRLFTVEKDSSHIPQEDLGLGLWQECSPGSVIDFSAVAFFFGRELHQHVHVPIGLIHASWGGSRIQAWMEGSSLKRFDEYSELVQRIEKSPAYFQQLWETYEANGGNIWLSEYYRQEPGLKDNGELKREFVSECSWNDIKLPGYWEESVLESFDGTVWFRKVVTVPECFKGRELSLNLGWIDDYDIAFVNGERVGSTYYKGTNRTYPLSGELTKSDTLEILIAVHDVSSKGGFWGPNRINLTDKYDPYGLNIDLEGIWHYNPGLNVENAAFHTLPDNPRPRPRNIPTFLYNAMIAPLTDFAIKGVIWYQGEGNAGNPEEYSRLFPEMIRGWRHKWNQGDFPFLFVQLANYGLPSSIPGESNWAELREAQSGTLQLPGTAMAVTIDLGDAMDVHPVNKQDVGKRLALAARHVAYREQLVYSGPLYDSLEVTDGKVKLWFKHADDGLVSTDKHGYVNEFEIAGPDGSYHWAKAYIEDTCVIVMCDKIPEPVSVRYAWSDNPEQANLYNRKGLPASPFRTYKTLNESEATK